MRELKILNCNKKCYLSNYILNIYPNLSRNLLFKAIRNKDIRVNDKKISSDLVIKNGDIINIYISDNFLFGIPNKLNYIYVDDNILAVYKPQGILSNEEFLDDGNLNNQEPTLEDLVKKDYANAKICHRLDRNTAGIVIFSLNDTTYYEILLGFKKGAINKNYIAYVYNCDFKKSEETLEKYIKEDSKTGYSKIYDTPVKNSQKIITKYNVIYKDKIKNYAILNILIHTGRTHQIRAQLKDILHPIIGDPKYGKNEINKEFKVYKQLLFAYKYTFNFDCNSPLSYLNNISINLDEKYYINKII